MPEENVEVYRAPQTQLTFFYASGLSAAMASAGATAQMVISVLADADFLCNYITCTVIQANLVVTDWGGTVQVTDSAAGRTLFNTPVRINHILGDGSLPYPLNPPRYFDRNSTITIDLTSPVATGTTVEICLHGVKIFQ